MADKKDELKLIRMNEVEATEISWLWYEGKGITDTMRYYQAQQRAPRRISEVIADIMRKPPEKVEPERSAPERKRSAGLEI